MSEHGDAGPGWTSPPAVPPGWYQDPADPRSLRWWDGTTWTGHTSPAQMPPDPGYGWPPHQAQGYQPYGPAQYGGTAGRNDSNTLSTIGIVLGAIAFVFFPILFGPAGLVLGAVARSRGERRAVTAMVVSGIGLVVGMILGAVIYSSVVT
jgi:hypothetical protein